MLKYFVFLFISFSSYAFQYASTSPIINTSPVSIKASQGKINSIQMINTSATPTIITLSDGGSVVWQGYLSASQVNIQTITFPRPLSFSKSIIFAANTSGANIFVNVQGDEGK